MAKIKISLVFGICTTIVFGYVIYALVLSGQIAQRSITGAVSPKAYRFVCLYSGENEYFSGLLKEGINDAMNEHQVWVSFYSFNTSELEKHCLAFEKAIESNVDGIITNVPDLSSIGPLIDRAAGEKIPVITIVNDFYGSQRKTYIGVDYYSFGSMAAKYLNTISGGNARTVTISSSSYELSSEYRQKLTGYRDFIIGHTAMSLGCEYMEQVDYLNAYSCAESALSTRIGYDSFYCMDELTTLAVANRLKESDNTGISVVGCGESEMIYEFLRQGILDAVLTEDPYFVGSTAVAYMVKFKRGEKIPATVYTEINVLTQKNVNELYHP